MNCLFTCSACLSPKTDIVLIDQSNFGTSLILSILSFFGVFVFVDRIENDDLSFFFFGVQKRKVLKGFLCFHSKTLKPPLMDSAIRGRSDKVHLDPFTRYLF